MGRVGVITHRERHDGGFNIVHIKDAVDNEFATREGNVFIIGQEKPWISLPKGKGVKVGNAATVKCCAGLIHWASFPSPKREIAAGLTTSPAIRALGGEVQMKMSPSKSGRLRAGEAGKGLPLLSIAIVASRPNCVCAVISVNEFMQYSTLPAGLARI